ncbi:MAG: ribosome maturation factor RimM [Armatimonadota bacterium]
MRNRKSSSPGSDEPWTLLIGEITAPQGLRGEVRVYPHTDFPDRFLDLEEIGLREGGGAVRVTAVEYARVLGRKIVLKLAGIDTIAQAESLRGTHLLVPQSWARELGEDEYYHHQLLGLDVVTTAGESLGRISDIWRTGANDVYETPLALVPATKDIIREIDLDHGRMVVDARPGLKKHEV